MAAAEDAEDEDGEAEDVVEEAEAEDPDVAISVFTIRPRANAKWATSVNFSMRNLLRLQWTARRHWVIPRLQLQYQALRKRRWMNNISISIRLQNQ